MSDFGIGDGLHKVLLAGIGALATGVEKGQEIVDSLVKKGELTVEQGKILNTELKRKKQEQETSSRQTNPVKPQPQAPAPGPHKEPPAGEEDPLVHKEPQPPISDPKEGYIPVTSTDPIVDSKD